MVKIKPEPSLCSINTIVLLLSTVLSSCFISCKRNIPSTAANIKKVRLGMPVENVVSILGTPRHYEVKNSVHNNTCSHPRCFDSIFSNAGKLRMDVTGIYNDTVYCCQASREILPDKKDRMVTLHYITKGNGYNYPMLWVHLDGDLKVVSVFVKEYFFWGVDDRVIYSLNAYEEYGDDALLNYYFK